MTVEITRAELFSRGVKGGAALLLVGAAASFAVPTAAADPLSDNDLAHKRLLVGVELLGIDFYTRAVDARKLPARAQKGLRAALLNEKEHYQSVAAILSGAGLVPAVTADFDFTYPRGSFDSAKSILRLGAQLEAAFMGAYLGALGTIQSSGLLPAFGSIAANQAQHLSLFQDLLMGRPIYVSFPKPMTIQQVSNLMDGFVA